MIRSLQARAALFAALLAASLLAACGDNKKPASQVAVKVNKEEITVHQLNNEMARLRGLTEEQRKGATKQVLDRLVDQELLVQRAMERKLDRDPRVMQTIEASKRQILAQAYLESVTAEASRPTAEEVRKFYADHPELFAQRKLYRLQELAIGAGTGLTTAKLEAELKKAKSLNDVVEWLKRERIPFNANSTVKSAEQLPMEIVPRLAALGAGQAMLMPSQQGHLIVQIAATESQPLAEDKARPFIEQYLANQKKAALARSEVKSLKDAATIEYVGDFAAAAAAAPAATPAPATPAPAAPAPAAAPAAPAAGEPAKSAIEQGIRGLK
ncbi:MAG: EpsD family peptidyl-prolyl cis-trans isomerase [Burkholderiales bacterium]|nr:EpsD family peptidyl-prolyl cis-trans isomerase [Burkholderiales bacterium]